MILPPLFRSSASSTFIHVESEVSSASVTSLPRARLIRRRIRIAVIQADTVVTTRKTAKTITLLLIGKMYA